MTEITLTNHDAAALAVGEALRQALGNGAQPLRQLDKIEQLFEKHAVYSNKGWAESTVERFRKQVQEGETWVYVLGEDTPDIVRFSSVVALRVLHPNGRDEVFEHKKDKRTGEYVLKTELGRAIPGVSEKLMGEESADTAALRGLSEELKLDDVGISRISPDPKHPNDDLLVKWDNDRGFWVGLHIQHRKTQLTLSETKNEYHEIRNGKTNLFKWHPLNYRPGWMRVEPISSVSHMSVAQMHALRLICIADTMGVGVEGWSRERILRNWDKICSELVYDRAPPYDKGLKKGMYTDDTEMSLALAKAISKNAKLTPDIVTKAIFAAYDDFARENGEGRGGYGRIREILALPTEERLAQVQVQRANPGRVDGPGNGAMIRLLPLLTDDSPHLLHNIIAQTIATHNHAAALLTNFVYADVADALINGRIELADVFTYAYDFLSDDPQEQHVLPDLTVCISRANALCEKYCIPLHGDFAEELARLTVGLALRDTLPGPADEKGSNLDEIISKILGPSMPHLGKQNESGLAPHALRTLFTTLYCWKWTEVDFNRSQDAWLNLMKRCISFGGDTDSLLVTTIPVSFMALQTKRDEAPELPEWLVDGCEELSRLDTRV